ncbi:MAG: AAA family ATPase [Opitutaceae bacterium]|nr:AAA family ATPase [Opitutaceae bacterium]
MAVIDGSVIEAVHFRNFRALRDTHLRLSRFNVVVGPNGSGKTSLIDALQRLRTLSRLPLGGRTAEIERDLDGSPEIRFRFSPPHEGIEATMSCQNEAVCDLLEIAPLPGWPDTESWPDLRQSLSQIRSYSFDHHALAKRTHSREGGALVTDGANLSAVLGRIQRESPDSFAAIENEVRVLFPEYSGLNCETAADGTAGFGLVLKDCGVVVEAPNLSQGTLYGLAFIVLAFDPRSTALVTIEEIDRGFHPRLFRKVIDVLYNLSHPDSRGLTRSPTQVIVTTHSPYVLDQFRDHPEEIVISSKKGETASFERLADRPDLLAVLGEDGTLGDLWYAGLFGGVPEDPDSEC